MSIGASFRLCPSRRLLLLFAVVLLLAGVQDVMAAHTRVKHRPEKYFVPNHRAKVVMTAVQRHRIVLARCYFRSRAESDFVFVDMKRRRNSFEALLPAPSATTEAVEYLFLIVNTRKNVFRTQSFTVGLKDSALVPPWQQNTGMGSISVYTELESAPAELKGFKDDLTSDIVESSQRFGMVVAGIYTLDQIEASGVIHSTTGSSLKGTTVKAGSGSKTTFWVLGGIGTGLLVTGAAVVAATTDCNVCNERSYSSVPSRSGNDAAGASVFAQGGEGSSVEDGLRGSWRGIVSTGTHQRPISITLSSDGVFSSSIPESMSLMQQGRWTYEAGIVRLVFPEGSIYRGEAQRESRRLSLAGREGVTMELTR